MWTQTEPEFCVKLTRAGAKTHTQSPRLDILGEKQYMLMQHAYASSHRCRGVLKQGELMSLLFL